VLITLNSKFSTQAEIIFYDAIGEMTCGKRIDLTPGWRTYNINLNAFNYSELENSVRFLISLNVEPIGYLDLGSIIIIENADNSENLYVNKPKINRKKINTKYLKLINSDLSGLRINNNFSYLKRKQLIAPGVVYEAKNDVESKFQARIGQEGIDLKVGVLNGYSRIAYSIDISSLTVKPMLGSISTKTTDMDFVKAIYIYAKGDEDKISNKLNIIVDESDKGISKLKFMLDVNSVSKILSDIGGNFEYRLAIQFDENCCLADFKVNLWQEDLMFKEEVFESIEDSSISSQLDVVSGYYDICMNPENIEATTALKVKQVTKECIDIVIPVYNAKEFVIKCLDSILSHTTMSYRIILMDDCSTDGVSEEIDKYAMQYEHISVIHHPKNVGYTANVNAGFEQSNSEWVLLLNSDTEVTPFWLENIYEATKIKNVAIIGPLGNAASWQSVPNVFSDKGGWDFNLLPKGITANDIAFQLNLNRQNVFAEAGVLNGFCQLINRKAFYDVGRLDEPSFPKGFGEENDLCARLVKNGYKLLVSPNSYVYHHKSKSFGHETRGELSKKGNLILKEKHPDYDWELVTKKLYNHAAMIQSRKIVSALFKDLK
jgi:GT2 family glycosyltransferase